MRTGDRVSGCGDARLRPRRVSIDICVRFIVEVRKTENAQPPRTENARGGARQYIYAATALY